MLKCRLCEKRIRGLIHPHWTEEKYWKSRPDLCEEKYQQFFGSLDVLGDTICGLEDYLGNLDRKFLPGELYIRTYGVLQILFVQQDAVWHMYKCLGLGGSEPDDTLLEIREVRNTAIGHPTSIGIGKERHYSGITRMTMTSRSFTLYFWGDGLPEKFNKYFRNSAGKFNKINLENLVHDQDAIIWNKLKQVEDHLSQGQ